MAEDQKNEEFFNKAYIEENYAHLTELNDRSIFAYNGQKGNVLDQASGDAFAWDEEMEMYYLDD